ncbi:MAG: hypothetical protein WC943_16090, partial [Elusimicrobiota bacterium]
MQFTYSFLPMGSTAPDPVPLGEVWLDVGNRLGRGVIDHHGGDAQTGSASQLVLEQGEALLAGQVTADGQCRIVLHSPLDLDAVCAAWITGRALELGFTSVADPATRNMASAISQYDQGFSSAERPLRSWPIVMRTLFGEEFGSLPDIEVLPKAFSILQATHDILSSGCTLEEAAERIATPTVKAVLSHAELAYRADIERATRFQIRLPVRLLKATEDWIPQGPARVPDLEEEWALADAVFFKNPRSSLFKEMARGDRRNSTLGFGFSLLLVSQTLQNKDEVSLFRHIASTDPCSGFHLKGLGAMLEAMEKRKEDSAGGRLPPGRVRLAMGAGRDGTDVASPWYDGRGHGFTIIDSPSRGELGTPALCASLLSPEEFLEAVWEYGNPSRFVPIIESRTTCFHPVVLGDGWEKEWEEAPSLSSICPGVDAAIGKAGAYVRVYRRKKSGGHRVPAATAEWLFEMPGKEALWAYEVSSGEKPADLRDVAKQAEALDRQQSGIVQAPGLESSSSLAAVELFQLRVPRSEVSMPPEGAT